MCIAIYLIVLGLLMSIILSCSLFGFLYRDIESWKVKSLIWMTWYYLWNGIVFTYLIKGVVIFYEELDLIPINVTFENYLGFKSFHADVLYVAAVLLLIASLMSSGSANSALIDSTLTPALVIPLAIACPTVAVLP